MAAIIDIALEQLRRENRPIRIALIGAGFMARGIALQIAATCPAIKVVGVAARDVAAADSLVAFSGLPVSQPVDTARALARAVAGGQTAITEDWRLLCAADGVDAVVEATGSIEYAANIACATIGAGKHIILMNAELDGTVGPILAHKARSAGVVFTNVDGDQPGVTLNLYRFVKGIGIRPVLCGNIKGLHDPYRNPTTQAAFAARWRQKAHMVTSFADGTKVSFEQAIVANATGMVVAKRGMIGPTVETGTPIELAADRFPAARLIDGPPIVDYVVGAAPSPGVFVLGTISNAAQRHYLELYKLGSGPIYCFYTPYHLCHFEVPNTIARATLFGDAAITPAGAPAVEVVTAMKASQVAGTALDDIGHYMTYGLCENAEIARARRLLPIGVAAGCRLKRNVSRDEVLTRDDVEVPEGRLVDRLREEQEAMFPLGSSAPTSNAGSLAAS